MSESNPNLVTVFSPAGEKFEVTKLNARDLTSHAGWTTSPPANVAAPAASTEPEVTEPEVTEPEVTEPEVTEPEVTEPEVTEPEVTEPEVTAEPTARLTADDFNDLEDRAAVRSYIEATFPGTEIDGRWNRDKLVALAIELATAE